MPAYMYLDWTEHKLKFKAKPTGKRRYLPIPYFSGTMFSVEVVMRNESGEPKKLSYHGELFRLAGVAHETADHIGSTEDRPVTLDPGRKIRRRLELAHLPQPGNYSLKLALRVREGRYPTGSGDIVYFDALPRDATITNWTINIMLLVLGTLLGGIAGWIAGNMGD